TWQARLSRPRVLIDTLSSINREIIDRFERSGCSVTLLNITMENGVPSFLAVLRGKSVGFAQLVAAGATSLNPDDAARKALEELDHTRTYCQRLRNEAPFLPSDTNHENVVSQRDHLTFWCDPARQSLADFLTASEEVVDFRTIANLSVGDPACDLKTI